jgi:hypothetical protein
MLDGATAVADPWRTDENKRLVRRFDRIHTVLGEGDFVLVVSEGRIAGQPTAVHDLIPIDIRCM